MVEPGAAQAERFIVLHEEQALAAVAQPAHVHWFNGSTTTRSGDSSAWRSRSTLRAERPGETQCVRQARLMSGRPLTLSPTLNRSWGRSRVRARYAVSLGVRPRRVAQVRSVRIAVDCLPRPAWTIRSRQATRPCRHGSRCGGGKPAQVRQHVDGADVALLGQGGLGIAHRDDHADEWRRDRH